MLDDIVDTGNDSHKVLQFFQDDFDDDELLNVGKGNNNTVTVENIELLNYRRLNSGSSQHLVKIQEHDVEDDVNSKNQKHGKDVITKDVGEDFGDIVSDSTYPVKIQEIDYDANNDVKVNEGMSNKITTGEEELKYVVVSGANSDANEGKTVNGENVDDTNLQLETDEEVKCLIPVEKDKKESKESICKLANENNEATADGKMNQKEKILSSAGPISDVATVELGLTNKAFDA